MTVAITLLLSVAVLMAGGLVGAIIGMLLLRAVSAVRQPWVRR